MAIDFKTATDELLTVLSHEELATELGVSVPTVRQARLDGAAKAHRRPPEGWQKVVVRLAKKRAAHLQRLVNRLEAG